MSKRDGTLAAIAIVSVIIYALACRPAWHPSGKQVAFGFAEEDSQTSGVAVYDLETKEVRRLLETEGEEFGLAQCLWTSDGQKLIAVSSTGNDELRVTGIDAANGQVETVATVEGIEDPIPFLAPVLANDRYLWLGPYDGAEGEIRFSLRVDLQEKKVERFFSDDKKQTFLYDFGERGCLYLQALETVNGDTSLTFGAFDPVAGTLATGVAFPMESEEASYFLAAEPGGTRLAAVSGDDALVLFDEEGKVAKTIPLPEWVDETGYVTWTGKSVWMAATRTEGEGENRSDELGLLSVDVDSSQAYFMTLQAGDDAEESLMSLQPAVSPDGRRLAVSGVMLKPAEGQPPAALILVSLDGEPGVTRVPLPVKKAPLEKTEDPPAAPAEEGLPAKVEQESSTEGEGGSPEKAQ